MSGIHRRRPAKRESEQRFAGILRDYVSGRVPQADNLVPIVPCRRIRRYERAEREREASGPRQFRFVSQNPPRAVHANRTNRTLRIYRGFERSQLEWTNARRRRKSSLRVNHNRFAVFQCRIHLFCLADTRLRIAAIERELAASPSQSPK